MKKHQFINFRFVLSITGNVIEKVGLMMLLSLVFSIYPFDFKEIYPILLSFLTTYIFGFMLRYISGIKKTNENYEIMKREGYLIVALGWISASFFCTLPYLYSGAIPDISNAFFESVSGLTTTGASILDDIESLPDSILLWRSITQWIGGMGIIVLVIAILPLLGVGGMELFASEAPGPTKDKIHPRIKETAKRLWIIYVGLTVSEILLLWVSGMNLFDSVNHSFTTMSTGGFSTKQSSVGYFTSPLIQYIIIVFMFLAGTNFTLLYFFAKFKYKKLFKNDEFRWYLYTVIGITLFVTLINILFSDQTISFEQGFRASLFQTVSIITTTGYATYDFTLWGSFITFLFFLLLFTGASAGSTSGGVKLVRIILLMKNGVLEFKRRLHPNAVVPLILNGEGVSSKIVYNLLAFIFFYLFIFVNGSILITFLGVDFVEAISSVATSLGNVGPGIGNIGPSHSFNHLPMAAKWILGFLMLMGRLELFTIAIILTPYFWKKN